MAQQSDNWIIVDDLMREVMEALAHGHAALVERSESPLGRLAVKTADLTLDFDLSAKAKTESESFRLQVKPTPFFGFSTSTFNEKSNRQVELRNHAQLVIQIVNVPPAPEQTDVSDGRDGADNGRSDRESDDERREAVIDAINQIQQFIRNTPNMKIAIDERELTRIYQDFEAAKDELASVGSETLAIQKIEPFYSELRTAIMAQVNTRSVKPSIERLDDWLDWQPEPETDPEWRERLQVPLTNLRQLVGDLPMPPAVKGQFNRRAEQVLASANETEAANRLVAAVADLKQRTQKLSLPEEVRRTLDSIKLD
jgi:hypothetical protein